MPDEGARRTGPALEGDGISSRAGSFRPWTAFPRRQKFLLGDRIQTTALTGLERLVEATFTRNRGRLLDRVNVDLDSCACCSDFRRNSAISTRAATSTRRVASTRWDGW